MLCACVYRPISQPNWVNSERLKYLWNQDNTLDLSEHIIWPKHISLPACTLCPCMLFPYLIQIWLDEEIRKTCRTSLSPYLTKAHKFACMHTMRLRAWAHISAKLGWIRNMKVSMDSREHTGPIWVHNMTQAHKLACMHIIFLHTQTQISAKFCHSSKIKVSMESQDYFQHIWKYYSPVKAPNSNWRPQNSRS